MRKRRILPVISRKGAPTAKRLGKLRYVAEQTFSLLHRFKHLAVRWERRRRSHPNRRGSGPGREVSRGRPGHHGAAACPGQRTILKRSGDPFSRW
ncbi:hypothetical protein ACFV8E_23725 [Streptomyces sp. NPDC059849]|uniref:hypothetical protein n=1 Tax=Streptomyces sp. NPDC059849 TaxID=3346969 RepID=UPI00364F1B55